MEGTIQTIRTATGTTIANTNYFSKLTFLTATAVKTMTVRWSSTDIVMSVVSIDNDGYKTTKEAFTSPSKTLVEYDDQGRVTAFELSRTDYCRRYEIIY